MAEIHTTAGAGGVIQDERVTGRIKFPALWLHREGLNPAQCRIVRVAGEAMEPALPDGCSILVNREQPERRHGKVFVVRVGEDERIVRRALENPEAVWLMASDKQTDSQIRLEPESYDPQHEAIEIDPDTDDWAIVGVVVGAIIRKGPSGQRTYRRQTREAFGG